MAAVFLLADPDRRRRIQAEADGDDDKEVVKEYFNNNGFQRTVEMLIDEGPLQGVTVCDAGCGTGCLSSPLAKEGAIVSASDISVAMVAEAKKQVRFSLIGALN
nr:magnesium protoporphyrin IX methyltransferase, chloroplastic [Ipomoea batatas]